MQYKKVNKGGGITIPQQLRHQLGISTGTPLAIEADENGLHISKYIPTCMLCGSPDDVVTLHGYEICRRCGEAVVRRFGGNDSTGNQSEG